MNVILAVIGAILICIALALSAVQWREHPGNESKISAAAGISTPSWVQSFKKTLPPWQIVQSPEGEFNFTQEDGRVFPLHSFATREEAERLRDSFKRQHDERRPEVMFTPEQRAEHERVARTEWRPLDESQKKGE